jgi:hypothetical protein
MQSQAFFSTTFFSFGDDGWKASKQIWVYWVITIPSTLLVLVIWGLWIQYPDQTLLTFDSWKKWFKRRGTAKPKEDV